MYSKRTAMCATYMAGIRWTSQELTKAASQNQMTCRPGSKALPPTYAVAATAAAAGACQRQDAHRACAPSGPPAPPAVSASGSNSASATSANSLKPPPFSEQAPSAARVVTGESSRAESPASRPEPALAGLMLPMRAAPLCREASRAPLMLPDQLRARREPLQSRWAGGKGGRSGTGGGKTALLLHEG